MYTDKNNNWNSECGNTIYLYYDSTIPDIGWTFLGSNYTINLNTTKEGLFAYYFMFGNYSTANPYVKIRSNITILYYKV